MFLHILGFDETAGVRVAVGAITGVTGVLVNVAGARKTRMDVDVLDGRIAIVFVGLTPPDKSQL
jgi:hypothetical protein